jgi:hypothetical protein
MCLMPKPGSARLPQSTPALSSRPRSGASDTLIRNRAEPQPKTRSHHRTIAAVHPNSLRRFLFGSTPWRQGNSIFHASGIGHCNDLNLIIFVMEWGVPYCATLSINGVNGHWEKWPLRFYRATRWPRLWRRYHENDGFFINNSYAPLKVEIAALSGFPTVSAVIIVFF